jgi:hypothetical protein
MPGMELNFECPCGFKKEKVTVGATQHESYCVFLCLSCHLVFSLKIKNRNQNSGKQYCRHCHGILKEVTEPGGWGPEEIQKKFPDMEPWLIGDTHYSEEDEIVWNFDLSVIRVLCPNCGLFSLDFTSVAFWDD